MGWKALKEYFGITHIVQVAQDKVLIGSGYVSDIATIDSKTGEVATNMTFPGFLKEHYPALLAAKPADIVQLLESLDTFSASVPVFTYEGGKIIEKFCEEPGWPNVTHDGCVMYDNSYSTDKEKVVRFARRNAEAGIRLLTESILDAEKRLAAQRADLAECEADLAELNAAYPASPLLV